jgi:hypothetical protein
MFTPMFGWLTRFFGKSPPAAPAAEAAVRPHPSPEAAPVAAPTAVPAPEPLTAPEVSAPPSREAPPSAAATGPLPCPSPLVWLLQVPPPEAGELRATERPVLDAIEATLNVSVLPPGLVPRAPAVIPQLLSLMRHQDSSREELVDRISKDLVLAAEVLRLARSPYYRTSSDIDTLSKAVAMIGISGLKSAIARVVLKPLYDAKAGGWAAQAATRNWPFTEHQSERCAGLAADIGLDRFEGFLAGMLHSTGRTALLRIVDRTGLPLSWPCSSAMDEALQRYSHRLYGRFMVEWKITPPLTQAGQLLAAGHEVPPQTLAWAVLESERLSVQDLAPALTAA